tara:strand:+ start:3891 stop:4754 length:864 start_codon:yes stop_codon:yes gene_type:complete
MSQVSDVSIANQGFSAFRTELNNILGALNSMHSGTSRPSSATTGTMWLDTTNSGSNSLEIKFFDGSDDISVATIDTSANTINFLDSVVTGINIVTDTSPQLGGDLDTNSFNIKIDDAHGLFDENNNEQLIFQTTASAVNFAELTNSATGNDVGLAVDGSDTNVGLSLSTKGSGKFKFNDSAYFPEATLTDASTIAWDVQSSPVAKVTLGDNRTLGAGTNAVAGQFVSLLVIQDGTGSRTLSFNAVYEFTQDTAPTLTTTASKGDLFVFRYNGSKFLEVGRNLNLTLS